jgi:hypothetical protein
MSSPSRKIWPEVGASRPAKADPAACFFPLPEGLHDGRELATRNVEVNPFENVDAVRGCGDAVRPETRIIYLLRGMAGSGPGFAVHFPGIVCSVISGLVALCSAWSAS